MINITNAVFVVLISIIFIIIRSNKDNYYRPQNSQQRCSKTKEGSCSFKNTIKITIPKRNKNAIEKIEELFKRKSTSQNIKWNFETVTVKEEKLKCYMNFLIEQFDIENDPEEKASLRKLLIDKSDQSSRFIVKNGKNYGEYSVRLVYIKDIDDLTKQIISFSYATTINFKDLSSWYGLFEDKLSEICSEDNMRMYLYYKLAEYSKNHGQDIQIEYSEQPKI
ncbi:hypothetical protein BpHYR1_020694 [Brachionus plicatilis]|uniref:Uncharacterized protein n=1 Tax=Brachionus plicatilis TaxID=10195 RepID=A0A3M7T560_BRAPC|nr:hypothetical protein BpHYR1_020694 [Brachionus plicatilis]